MAAPKLRKEQINDVLADNVTVSPAVNANVDVQSVLEDHETRVDNLELNGVTKVGTPIDNQIAVWTGDGTIEGTSGATYDGSTFSLTGNFSNTGTVNGRDIAADGIIVDLAVVSDTTGVTGADPIVNAISLTQSEFDNIVSPDANTLYYITDAPEYRYITLYLSDGTSDLAVATDLARCYCPYTGTITNIIGTLGTAPTGSSIILDVNLNGSTIMTTNKIEIEATETSSTTATTPPGLTTTSVTEGDIFTADVDQIGSTIAGSGFTQIIIEIDIS